MKLKTRTGSSEGVLEEDDSSDEMCTPIEKDEDLDDVEKAILDIEKPKYLIEVTQKIQAFVATLTRTLSQDEKDLIGILKQLEESNVVEKMIPIRDTCVFLFHRPEKFVFGLLSKHFPVKQDGNNICLDVKLLEMMNVGDVNIGDIILLEDACQHLRRQILKLQIQNEKTKLAAMIRDSTAKNFSFKICVSSIFGDVNGDRSELYYTEDMLQEFIDSEKGRFRIEKIVKQKYRTSDSCDFLVYEPFGRDLEKNCMANISKPKPKCSKLSML